MKKALMTAAPLLILITSQADARPARISQIPNAPQQCATCHTTASGGPRNAFGQDVEATLIGSGAAGTVNWIAVANLDSDGDSFSNGQELGDPNGNWQTGDPAPTGSISEPGNSDSTPQVDPEVPNDGGNAAADEADDAAGGCQTTGNSQAFMSPLLAVGFLWMWGRRRGRSRGGRAVARS